MGNHFLSRFDAGILKRTLIFLIIAALLITISFIGKGLNGNPLIVIMYFIGFVLLFYALLRPWQKVTYYLIQSFVLIVAFVLLWIFGFDLLFYLQMDEDVAWSIGFAIIAGVIGSMIGIFTLAKSGQRLPFAGAALSLLTIIIMISPAMSPPPILNYLTIFGVRILIVLQVFITIMLFRIGYVGINKSKLPKTSLAIMAIVQILVAIWVFFALMLDVSIDFRFAFWNTQMRLVAVLQVIIAIIALYFSFRHRKINLE